MKRIGIFGGSFDPVHNAHVALARLALDQLALDEVRWVPAGRQWQKSRTLTSATHRAAMVELAIADEPRFTLDRCEIVRSGASYTLDTVRELQTAEPGAEWVLIIGQDQYAGLHTWLGWEKLLGRVRLAVANRPGAPTQASPAVEQVERETVALPMMDISSTDIRDRLASGRDIATLVPTAVARYIEHHHLYRGTYGI